MRESSRDQLLRLRRLCLALPEVSERLSHGEPTFFAKKKVFAMFDDHHHGADRIAVWLPAAPGEQEALVAEAPEVFFRPPYVGPSGWVGIHLDKIDDGALAAFVQRAWKIASAPKPKKRG